MAQEDTYEIGLVMAGAISAGAYTAGVVDYLLEALMHYEKVRKKFADDHPGQSLHNVQIRVISGASAGGMTGTMLLSAMMDSDYRPMRGYDPDAATDPDINNVFYRSWVSRTHGIDIEYMLDTSDITGTTPLKSLLNCKRLDEIADQALRHPRILQKYDYIPQRIDHFLSVFNLGGVPYTVNFEGSDSQYGLTNHSDMMHFVHDAKEDTIYDPNEIPIKTDTTSVLDANWELLKQSTLATGAFPIALEPRDIGKDRKSYNEWKWWVPQCDTQKVCQGQGSCFCLTKIPPNWPNPSESDYRFVSVDGGVANNEPLEVARRTLAGDALFNPRNANDACRSVIMVDPFPGGPRTEFTYEGINLFKIASKLFGSLKGQARFKPEEMELAADPNIFSRFMIAPSRNGAAHGMELASASVGAFGGFLSEKFRQHDFQLGRANCQSFLTTHFIIGLDNALVKEHIEWFRENHCIVPKKDAEYVQVIPMVNLQDTPIIPIPYDSVAMNRQDLDTIITLIDIRIKTVLDKSYFINEVINKIVNKIDLKPFKWLADKGIALLKGKIASGLASWASGKIQKIMEKDLTTRGLLK
ncbi:MAG: patatin-like phospholipase family protein [Sulfuricurvum sp.]|uniref:patatin-like phospholipase family protein n=1 Tax=Sulfuricurvum sp. TaxID=2025608 RepID=UPI0025FC8281|nr:patatin-like phospholipase family protein [Sulfuricurvum sp.]MCK9372613.1 patatin-like phospholipase family protein [Sulfuricurvum sp.]